MQLLEEFLKKGLGTVPYPDRNKPEVNGTSRLSPYLHFGHISAGTVAMAARVPTLLRMVRKRFLSRSSHGANWR